MLRYACVCVCGNPVTKDFESYSLILSIAQLLRWTIRSRGLAAYSVMPANEASGIGGRSYGRIALYLQEVSLARFVLHYNNSIRLETLRFFLVKIKIVAIIREVKNSSRCLLRNRISSKPKHKKDGKKAQKATIENRLRPETHVCVCCCLSHAPVGKALGYQFEYLQAIIFRDGFVVSPY